jgi:hypothetical protein
MRHNPDGDPVPWVIAGVLVFGAYMLYNLITGSKGASPSTVGPPPVPVGPGVYDPDTGLVSTPLSDGSTEVTGGGGGGVSF